jgi:anti-sigma factor RsiW
MVLNWIAAMETKRQSAPAATKTCDQLSVDLSAYFDGELEGVAREQMEAHLRGCEACSHKLDSFTRLRVAMTGLSRSSKSHGSVVDALKAELRSAKQSPPAKRRLS